MPGAALVKQASPVAWQHINLYGRYEFRKQPEPVTTSESFVSSEKFGLN